MLGLIWRRILQLVPVAIGATFIAFCVLNLLPGGTVYGILGPDATNQAIHRLEQQLGLNKPLLVRYGHWFWQALQGHLGTSVISSQPVSTIISTRIPVSAELGLFGIVLALVVSIPLAVLSARRPGGVIDRISTLASIIVISSPGFVTCLLLILVIGLKFRLLPTYGFVPLSSGLFSNLRSLILPAVALSTFPFAIYLRVLRGDMVQQLATGQYVITARGMGLPERHILLRHVLPNSLFGMITVLSVNLGLVLGGSVIVETIFAIPGMGNTLIQAINNRDSPVVQGIVLVLAMLIVGANLLADIVYMVLDPRVRVRHGQ